MLNPPRRGAVTLARWRHRASTVLAAALVAASAIAGLLLQTSAAAELTTTLAGHWRGAYDLLVLPANVHGDSLVEPNFAEYQGQGIDLAQLNAVRAVDGVSLAAPLAWVGLLKSTAYWVSLGRTDPASAPCTGTPRVHRVRYRVTADDGITPRVIYSSPPLIVADACVDQHRPSEVAVTAADAITADSSVGRANPDDPGQRTVEIIGPGVPETVLPVVAVDPQAEAQLLGEELGKTMEPLSRFEAALATGAREGELVALAPEQFQGYITNPGNPEHLSPFVPIVVSDVAYMPVRVNLDVDQVAFAGSMADLTHGQRGIIADGPSASLLQAASKASWHQTFDVTSRVGPFTISTLALPLQPHVPFNGAIGNPGVETAPVSIEPLSMRNDTSAQGTPHRQLLAKGTATLGAMGGATWTETAYRAAGKPLASPRPRTFAWLPLGTYHPADFTPTSDVAYVPWGTYAATKTVVTEGPFQGHALSPTPTGRGVILPPPGAITTLTAMTQLNPHAKISAIRVRVSGIDQYGPDSDARLAKVAGDIAHLGLEVRVVAGSSLSPVSLSVPQFLPDGSDLGVVRQEWTSLGAAVQVRDATTTGLRQLFATSLTGAALLGGVSILLGQRDRARESGLLRRLGWTPRRTTAWFLAADAPSLALAAAAVIVGMVTHDPWARALIVLCSTLLIAALLFSAVIGARPGRPNQRRSGRIRPVVTSQGLALRTSRARLAELMAVSAGIAVVGLLCGQLPQAVLQMRAASGGSRLAHLVHGQLVVGVVSLVSTGLVAGLCLTAIGARTFGTTLRPEVSLLARVGWTRAACQHLILHAALPALVVGWVLAVIAGTLLLGRPSGLALVGLISGPLVAAVIAVLTISASAKEILRA